jgi:hypothetical protein
MISPTIRFTAGALALTGLAVGCSSQAGPDYAGEPLAVIHGAVVANGTAASSPPAGAQAAVLWLPRKNVFTSATAQVEGSFPSQFSMKLYAPPPAEALEPGGDPLPVGGWPMTLDRGPLALGWIVALAANADPTDIHPADVLGYSLESMVAYLDRDGDSTNPDDEVVRYAALWQFPPTKGYHLLKLEWSDRTAYDRCVWNGFCYDQTEANPEHVAPVVWRDGRIFYYANQLFLFLEAAAHQSYESCLQAFPDADRCTIVQPDPLTYPDGYDPTNNEACAALAAQHDRTAFVTAPRAECGVPLRRVSNPDEFAMPVTVTMGTTFWNVLL